MSDKTPKKPESNKPPKLTTEEILGSFIEKHKEALIRLGKR